MVPERVYRGVPGEFEMRVALCGESPQLELLEPLRGPSIYHEWLDQHGEGLHHVGVHVPDIGDAMSAMAEAGVEAAQWGRGYGAEGDGGFAYYDLRPLLEIYVELIEVPAQRIPPEQVYPSSGHASSGDPEVAAR